MEGILITMNLFLIVACVSSTPEAVVVPTGLGFRNLGCHNRKLSVLFILWISRVDMKVEVCTGLDLARGPGLGLVFVNIYFGPGSKDSSQTVYRTFRAFSGHRFLSNKKLFAVALILCLWHSRSPETNPTALIFVAAPPPPPRQEIVRDNTLQTRQPIPYLKWQNSPRYC
jgi:hypothetical protein